MTEPATLNALDYYARHSCALFPIPYGSKNPTGIISSFAHDYSTDPAQWAAWYAQHRCNFGLISGPSRIIIADVDVSEIGRDKAWQIWSEWWTSRELAVPAPHTQSARGGWHTLFALPADVDIAALRQIALIGPTDGSTKAIVDLRVGNGFVVAAGSYYDGTAKGEASGHYLMMTDAPPHPAPAELIDHCRRAPTRDIGFSARIGTRDKGDVAQLMSWLTERGAFDAYEEWLAAGMALKLEYGDDGLELWGITHNDTVTPDVIATKWNSFAADPQPGVQTLNSLLDRAHKMGWRGSVRKSAASMFDGVAQIAAAAGATLASQMPTGAPSTVGMPMLAGQEELVRQCTSPLQEFLATVRDVPIPPIADDYPRLPEAMSGHGLYEPMQECLARIMSLAEGNPKPKGSRFTHVLIALGELHEQVFEAVCRRLNALGIPTEERKIQNGRLNLREKIERITVTHAKWEYDIKSGDIQSDNPDNVIVFLGVIGCEVRWNEWLQRMEIMGGSDVDLRWTEWTAINDTIVDKLLTRAKRTKTRFKPTDTFLRSTLNSLAHDNPHDPVLEFVNSLQWDGVSRLPIWLTATCGVPCDPYYQAVGKNVIGGMVKRVRNPGAKHDEVMILMGPQGTAKSTLCRALAMRDEWFTDSVTFDGSPQNIVPQLFGKMVVELAELDGMAKREVQSIKRFISAQSDNVTLKYEKFADERNRRCIFIGTSNEDSPLVDVTGNRRFLPVRLSQEINITWLRENIEQLVAEAVHLHREGCDFTIPRTVWDLAAKHQEAARSISDIEMYFSEWFAETEFTQSAFVSTQDLGFLTDLLGLKRIEGLRNAIMRRLGFRECHPYIDGRKTRGWVRGPDMLPKHMASLPRYMVGEANGRPRVTIRTVSQPSSISSVVPMPPLPGPGVR